MRAIVGGVGYRNLRDHSLGVEVTDRLAARAWPLGVTVEDLSYNAIAVVQRLEDEPPERRFTRGVFVTAVARGGDRRPGRVTCYRWDGVLPPPEEVQRAVGEAVTGVISLDNTLVVAGHFRALPEEVAVVEVEPGNHEFGDAFSPPVARVFDEVCDLVVSLVTDPRAAARLARRPLGGSRAGAGGGLDDGGLGDLAEQVDRPAVSE